MPKHVHPVLLMDDVLRTFAKEGIFVTEPMRGVCKQWRKVALEFPRVTIKQLRTPLEECYLRSRFYEKTLNQVQYPSVKGRPFSVYMDRNEFVTTQEKLISLVLHMTRSTFTKFAVRPIRQTERFKLYSVETALKVTMKHTQGVWGLLRRRWRNKNGLVTRIKIDSYETRDRAMRMVYKQVYTKGSDLYDLPNSAKTELLRITSLYY